MTVRIFLIGSVIASLLSWVIWIFILNFLDPERAGILGFFLFFLVLFLSVASTTSLIGYGVRRLVIPSQLSAYAVKTALRQGILFGVFLDTLLIIQRIRLYRWWVAVSLMILFLFIELISLGYDRTTHRKTS